MHETLIEFKRRPFRSIKIKRKQKYKIVQCRTGIEPELVGSDADALPITPQSSDVMRRPNSYSQRAV